ncbi:hypothetical protein FXV91_03880 [Methanosarcina sp. DH2]|nr:MULTISPECIES: hypothetical protein [unclassified Methanosarcina]MCC4769373.1 hypothetical protein [Methanosarcina sp. DH2]MDY9925769.1 hypothetical protein [Methanosarcina sp.]
MEEIFKGLVERAQYYEQFESFRNAEISGQFGDITGMNLKLKVSVLNL